MQFLQFWSIALFAPLARTVRACRSTDRRAGDTHLLSTRPLAPTHSELTLL